MPYRKPVRKEYIAYHLLMWEHDRVMGRMNSKGYRSNMGENMSSYQLEGGETLITGSGDRFVVVKDFNGKFWAISKNGMHISIPVGGLLRNYSGADTKLGNGEYDVKKIYKVCPFFNFDLSRSLPIYDFQESVRELTLEEIASKFNIPVDKLRIKDK